MSDEYRTLVARPLGRKSNEEKYLSAFEQYGSDHARVVSRRDDPTAKITPFSNYSKQIFAGGIRCQWFRGILIRDRMAASPYCGIS